MRRRESYAWRRWNVADEGTSTMNRRATSPASTPQRWSSTLAATWPTMAWEIT
jgi:hypothetical protein